MIKALSKSLNSKGFTLIELIVVIAILAVLVGIAAPNIIRYVQDSREKTDISNAAIIANGMLRAVAEGYRIAKTSGITPIEATTEVLIKPTTPGDNPDPDESLVPKFVQNLPTVKTAGYDQFAYEYDADKDDLKVYRISKDKSKITQLYPQQ